MLKLFFVCSLTVSFCYAFPVRNAKCVGIVAKVSIKIQSLLERAKKLEKDGKLQEAEWLFRRGKDYKNAERVHKKLRKILTTAKPSSADKWEDISETNAVARLQLGKTDVAFRYNDTNSEPAAYAFDQLCGFDIVPMSVARTFGKKYGSVQYFIFGRGVRGEGSDISVPAIIEIFDYLIGNADRNEGHNFLLLQGKKPVAIDHGGAFETLDNRTPVELIELTRKIADEELFERIKAVTDKEIHKALDMLVGRELVDEIVRRKTKYVELIEIEIKRKGRGYFFP